MKRLKTAFLIGIIFVLVTGTLAHFIYGWTGRNAVIGLFVPVNESVWEHMKLLFFPMLLYSLFLIFKFRKEYPCITASLCFGILAGTFLIPVFYYAYTAVLGRNVFLLDIGTFILSVLIAFLLSCRLTLSCRLKPYTLLLCILTGLLFVCFLCFTWHPPALKIFHPPIHRPQFHRFARRCRFPGWAPGSKAAQTLPLSAQRYHGCSPAYSSWSSRLL